MATGEPPVPPCSSPQEGTDTQSDIGLVVNSGIRPSDEQLLRLVDSHKPPASESMPSREYKEKSCPGGVRGCYCKRGGLRNFRSRPSRTRAKEYSAFRVFFFPWSNAQVDVPKF